MSIREQARAELPHDHLLVALMDQLAQPGDTDPEKMAEITLSLSLVLCQYEHRRTWRWLALWLLELVELHPDDVHLMSSCRLALAHAAGAYPGTGDHSDYRALEMLIRFYAAHPEFCPPDGASRNSVRAALNCYYRCGRPYNRQLLLQALCNVPWYELIADEQMLDAVPILAAKMGVTTIVWPGWKDLHQEVASSMVTDKPFHPMTASVIQADIRSIQMACCQNFVCNDLQAFRDFKIGPCLLLQGLLMQFLNIYYHS